MPGTFEDNREAALRRVRVRVSHITRENLRRAIVKVINETLAARDPKVVGQGDHHRQRLETFRFVGLEFADPISRPVRLERDHDPLAHGNEPRVHLFSGQELLIVRGRGHDPGPVAALPGRAERGELHRHARGVSGRSRVHRIAGVRLLARLKNIGAIKLCSPDESPNTLKKLKDVIVNRPID
ncbi:hypothetical protein JOF56_010006 [Kibdelosporangium banguiense]|uniref:Uncharacterized protein n=1 Tax=Kibdelosporangium banguiense TaxID=1365924 RepID=A0ABS4U0C8_9PSEU|nr:hypothetical protein [Kibdelosporangium banguiense]